MSKIVKTIIVGQDFTTNNQQANDRRTSTNQGTVEPSHPSTTTNQMLPLTMKIKEEEKNKVERHQ